MTSLKAVRKGYEYPLFLGTDTFARTGIDGAEVILPLFGGDEFVGAVPEGQWVKGWDANISVFTAKLDGAGALNLSGVAAAAGTGGAGWIDGQLPCVLIDGAEVKVELEVPVDDTGVTADRDIDLEFHLTKNKLTTTPVGDTDSLYVKVDVDETGILMSLVKRVASTATTIFDGSTYDDASARATGTGMFTIWRLVFHESHSGSAYRHVHVYLRQADNLANVEATTEYELSNSPYDISGLQFETAYPAYRIYTQNTTYFNAANDAVSQYVRASYPTFQLPYDCPTASLALGETRMYDTMGSVTESDWQRVRDVDHIFVGDAVIQNGLIRLVIDSLIGNGLTLYYYNGASWASVGVIKTYLSTSAVTCTYPLLHSIQKITSEELILKLYLLDYVAHGRDIFILATFKLRRGSYTLEVENPEAYPIQQSVPFLSFTNNGYAYCQGVQVSDNVLNIAGSTGSPLDNFGVGFKPTVTLLITFSEKTNGGIFSDLGNNLYGVYVPNGEEGNLYFHASPFALAANLFKEAESATISGAARTYLDGAGTDTVTEGQAVWTSILNCTINVNDATRVSVGAKDCSLRGTVAGATTAKCLPAAPLAKLTKFDSMKMYLSASAAVTVTITLYASSGHTCYKTQAIDTVKTQYTFLLPHSLTDMGDFTNTNFDANDFALFAYLYVGYTAVGAAHYVYLDGLHFYINTTTARGRGETLSGASAAVLDAQNEYTSDDILGVNNLPAGRYLLLIRAKDTDQVASDLNLRAYNATDALYLNEDGAATAQTLTSAFTYKAIVFDIRAAETGDTLNLKALKSAATENTIFVDYILIVPIGNGQGLPQDLSHGALRTATRGRRVQNR